MTRSLVSGATNFRDTGGLPAGGARTRTGVLYRSGNLVAVDDDGMQALRRLGIRRVIDLRDETEVAHAPSRLDDLAVEVQHEPLFLGSVASFFARDVSLDELYAAIVDDSADRVVAVVRGILSAQPVLVHCTVGKDRTGVTVAIALAAAGVDRDAVVADYARTEDLLPAESATPPSCAPSGRCTPGPCMPKRWRPVRPLRSCGRCSTASTASTGRPRSICGPTA
ncbi:protein-tyrosine phosphatase [Microbacterium sp. SORGH_AS 344]|nr:protein-tyrosine phosphatase [Microbacterium sp. SORGH_AS_0344]